MKLNRHSAAGSQEIPSSNIPRLLNRIGGVLKAISMLKATPTTATKASDPTHP
jgi:hypothetical protein